MFLIMQVILAKLGFEAGKRVGLVGLFGVLLAIGLWYFKDALYQVFHALGIVQFFDKLGLIVHEPFGLGETLFNILIFCLVAYAIIALLALVVGGLLFAVFASMDSEAGQKIWPFIGKTLAYMLVIPWVLLIAYPLSGLKEFGLFLSNPKKYIREAKHYGDYKKNLKHYEPIRHINFAGVPENEKPHMFVPFHDMPKNKDGSIDWEGYLSFTFGKESPKLNRVPEEEAVSRLNRLPILEDNDFLVGVARNLAGKGEPFEYHILLPKPKNMSAYDSKSFMCRPVYQVKAGLKKEGGKTSRKLDFENIVRTWETENPSYGYYEETADFLFLYFFDPCRINKSRHFEQQFQNETLRFHYKEYVQYCQDMYFYEIRDYNKELSNPLDHFKTKEEFNDTKKKLNDLRVYNEDIIELITGRREGTSI